MKRIEMNIEKCEQCPFLLLDHKNMISGCHATEQDIWVIDNISLIPDWCPLPDVEEKKNEYNDGYTDGWRDCIQYRVENG